MMTFFLKNISFWKTNETNRENYKWKRHFHTNFLRKHQKEYFSNINVKDLNHNKKLWKTIKPEYSYIGLVWKKKFLKREKCFY